MSHVPVYCELNIEKEKRATISREVWHYSRGDYVGLNHELLNLDWNSVLKDNVHIDDLTESFTAKLLEIAKRHIPIRKITIRSKDKPWCTKYIRNLIKKRNRWSTLYNRSGSEYHKLMRNIYRSKTKNEIRCTKMKYFNKQISSLTSISCKKYLSHVKKLYGNKIKKSIPTLIDNDKHYASDEEKATLLKDFLRTVH